MAGLVRVRQNAAATISHTFKVDETASDASGNVTYTVKRLDGSAVVSGTANHPGTTGLYQFALTDVQCAALDIFSVDWSGTVGGGPVVVRDYVEVCGGYLFSLDELRAILNTGQVSGRTYTTQNLIDARTAAEVACERITGRAFVPRFARTFLDGNNDFALLLPSVNIRAIRAVAVGTRTDDRVNLSGAGLTAVEFGFAGEISRRGAVWLWGRQNIAVEYEYGLDWVPQGIHDACIIHARHLLTQFDPSIALKAQTVNTNNGTTYNLSQPTQELVGIPAVDAAYARYDIGHGFA
jgi:hypothetical protein